MPIERRFMCRIRQPPGMSQCLSYRSLFSPVQLRWSSLLLCRAGTATLPQSARGSGCSGQAWPGMSGPPAVGTKLLEMQGQHIGSGKLMPCHHHPHRTLQEHTQVQENGCHYAASQPPTPVCGWVTWGGRVLRVKAVTETSEAIFQTQSVNNMQSNTVKLSRLLGLQGSC